MRTSRRQVRVSYKELDVILARGLTLAKESRPLALHAPASTSPKVSTAGKRADLNHLYVRSSWEANVARYLNFLQAHGKILKWEYEPDEFVFPVKRGRGKFYTPDFKVWALDGTIYYIEVKGWMDPVSATKLKRMQKYYPGIRIDLIDRTRYYHGIAPLKALLPNWEVGGSAYGI